MKLTDRIVFYHTKGRLRYSPKLVGNRSEKWWLILDCDNEIAKYYRHLHFLETYRCQKLQSPSWKAHVTVIRNEEPPLEKQNLWHKYEGKEIEFCYASDIRNNGLYYWLDVISEDLYEIRKELGLPRNPLYDFHLTIGNSIDSQPSSIFV